jgi:hypothetical protein
MCHSATFSEQPSFVYAVGRVPMSHAVVTVSSLAPSIGGNMPHLELPKGSPNTNSMR